jgi:hypothetical protein
MAFASHRLSDRRIEQNGSYSNLGRWPAWTLGFRNAAREYVHECYVVTRLYSWRNIARASIA